MLQLPPYHCELNAIKLIWANIKNYASANNRTFKLAEVRELLSTAISWITAEVWANCVKHVREVVEEKMWKLDNLFEKSVEPMVIELNSDESLIDEMDFGYWHRRSILCKLTVFSNVMK